MKAGLVVLLCGALTLGAAAPSHALKGYVDSRPAPGELAEWLVVQARPGEKNFVLIQRKPTDSYDSFTPDSVVITESGVATTAAGPGCLSAVRVISCDVPANADLVQLELSLGDGHDTAVVADLWYSLIIRGGSGNDRIDATADAPYSWGPAGYVHAGPGRDNIDVQNGDVDYVDCGSGADVVKADAIDRLIGC